MPRDLENDSTRRVSSTALEQVVSIPINSRPDRKTTHIAIPNNSTAVTVK
jgi:hypothetical protein